MSTFQLAGLPALQVQNANAPQASDANPAIQAIQQNAALERSGANNVGVQALQGIGSIASQFKQQDFQKQFGQAYANNDSQALQKLAADYPEQFQAIQQGMGFVDANKNQAIGNAAMDLRLATQQGPEAVQASLYKNAQALGYVGVDPDSAWQSYQQNPQQFSQTADLIGLHALGPQAYYTQQINAAKLAQQGQIAGANIALKQQGLNQQAQYQNAQVQQGWSQIGLTAQKNQIDAQDKQLNRQIQAGKVSNQSRNMQFQQIQKKQDVVNTFEQQQNALSGMLTTVNQVKQIDPSVFNRVFGFGGTVNSMLPGTESADAWNTIEQMQSQARQMGVIGLKGTGPVSNAEGQAAAKSFLALSQNVSPDRARDAINNWQKVLQRQTQYMNSHRETIDKYRSDIQAYAAAQQSGSQYGAPQPGYSEGGYTFTGGDPSQQSSWRKN